MMVWMNSLKFSFPRLSRCVVPNPTHPSPPTRNIPTIKLCQSFGWGLFMEMCLFMHDWWSNVKIFFTKWQLVISMSTSNLSKSYVICCWGGGRGVKSFQHYTINAMNHSCLSESLSFRKIFQQSYITYKTHLFSWKIVAVPVCRFNLTPLRQPELFE